MFCFLTFISPDTILHGCIRLPSWVCRTLFRERLWTQGITIKLKKLALLAERSFVEKKEICGTFCFETIIVKGFFSSLPFQFFLQLLFWRYDSAEYKTLRVLRQVLKSFQGVCMHKQMNQTTLWHVLARLKHMRPFIKPNHNSHPKFSSVFKWSFGFYLSVS